MLRHKSAKLGAFSVSRLSGAMLVAGLTALWPHLALSADDASKDDEKPHWQLAPIFFNYSVGGNLGYSYQRNTFGTNSVDSQAFGVGVNIGARVRSYFWQPWFSNITASIGESLYATRNSGNTIETYHSVDTLTTGDIILDLVKKSRFPFQAKLFRKNIRDTAIFGGTAFQTQDNGYAITQAYTNPNRRFSGHFYTSDDKTTGATLTPSDSKNSTADVRYQLTQYQSITASATHAKQDLPYVGQYSLFDSLGVTHYYRPNSIFSIASDISLANVSDASVSGGSTLDSSTKSRQFQSFASLRPEKMPLTITSSIRFMRADAITNGISQTGTLANNSNFNLGANYLFSPLIRLYGVINVQDLGGVQTVTTTEAVTGAKRFMASAKVGDYRYSGALGGGLTSTTVNINNAQGSASTPSQSSHQSQVQTLTLYLTHALDKSTPFADGVVTKNMNQTVSTIQNSNGSSQSHLVTSGTVSLHQYKDKQTTDLSLNASDSRNLGGTLAIFQMINLQASSNQNINTHESLSGNLTVQAIHSQYAGQVSPPTIAPTATLLYLNIRAFNIRYLQFTSSLRLSDTNIHPTLLPGYQDTATRSWDNNFDYRIGRLVMQLYTRIAVVGGNNNSTVLFSVSRSF